MYILIMAVIGLLSFLLFGDKKRWRELYPCTLFISLFRLTEQYIIADILHLWKYHKMLTPLSKLMNIPIAVDLFFYPLLGYLFIQKLPNKRVSRLLWVVLWSLVFTINENLAVHFGVIEQRNFWNPLLSYFLYMALLTFVILQYEWYKVKQPLPNGDHLF